MAGASVPCCGIGEAIWAETATTPLAYPFSTAAEIVRSSLIAEVKDGMRKAVDCSLKVVEGMPEPEMVRADGGLLLVGTVTEKG